MRNIQFIDRREELEILEKLRRENFFMVVRGRRRIGKTTLLRKAFHDAVYIFIWPNKSYQWIVGEICAENNLPGFLNFADIMRYILDKDSIVILDEFQNFLNIDKSVFGEMQKLIDERRIKNESSKIVVSGSSYSLVNRLFNNEASPLYGRRTHEMVLQELPVEELFASVKIGMEEFIKFWSVFGGVPYYYAVMDVEDVEKSVIEMIEKKDSMLLDEGKVILSVEFGRDSKAYNTVLTAIAEGKTRLNEIASLFSNKKGETIKYLDLLRKEFNLVRRVTPILSDPKKSREGVYEINDNFLSFWFYFIDKQRAYLEQERFGEAISFFEENFPGYVGRKFEKFITYLMKRRVLLPDFEFERIGSQWGSILGAEEGKNQYEIDILALNEKTKEILFAECKWQDKADARKILAELKEKAQYVLWNAGKRKEHYAIFAKSFKERIKEPGIVLFDLRDFERMFKSRERK